MAEVQGADRISLSKTFCSRNEHMSKILEAVIRKINASGKIEIDPMSFTIEKLQIILTNPDAPVKLTTKT